MRTLALLAAITTLHFCNISHAQIPAMYQPGYSGAVGPWQPSPFSSQPIYYNPSAPRIFPGYSYGYGGYWQDDTAYEVRRLRWAVEDASFQRQWRGR